MKCCECGSSIKNKGETHRRTVGFFFYSWVYPASWERRYHLGQDIWGPWSDYKATVFTLIPKCTLNTSSQLLKFILLQVQNTETIFLSDFPHGLEYFPVPSKRCISFIIVWAAKRSIIIAVKQFLWPPTIFHSNLPSPSSKCPGCCSSQTDWWRNQHTPREAKQDWRIKLKYGPGFNMESYYSYPSKVREQ